MSTKHCIIMRGASGAGKDWWISRHVSHVAAIISADQYFMNKDQYEFDREKLPEVHNECLRKFTRLVTHDDPLIVVNNTNTKLWEIAPYYRVAEAHGYDVEIVWVIAGIATCFARNTHATPLDVVKSMVTGVDTLPPWWNVRVVLNDDKLTVGYIT